MIETDMKQTYRFEDLGGLRDWLNQFTTIDLTTVRPNRGLNFVLVWYERPWAMA